MGTAVARFAYATGTPFNVLTDTSFSQMLTEVARFGPAYRPPNINQLREGLLDKEYAEQQEEIIKIFFERLKYDSCTLTSDGWSDILRHPLLNFMGNNDKGAAFLKKVDTKGESKVCTRTQSMPPAHFVYHALKRTPVAVSHQTHGSRCL